MSQILEFDLATFRARFRHMRLRDFAINQAGDTCDKTGYYFEVIIAERRMIDRIYMVEGQTFPALRATGNRWIYDFLTEIQYKTPNL